MEERPSELTASLSPTSVSFLFAFQDAISLAKMSEPLQVAISHLISWGFFF